MLTEFSFLGELFCFNNCQNHLLPPWFFNWLWTLESGLKDIQKFPLVMTTFWCARFVNTSHVSILTSLHQAFPTQMKASAQVGAIAEVSIPSHTFSVSAVWKKRWHAVRPHVVVKNLSDFPSPQIDHTVWFASQWEVHMKILSGLGVPAAAVVFSPSPRYGLTCAPLSLSSSPSKRQMVVSKNRSGGRL